MKKEQEEFKQTEKLEKLPDGSFKLVVTNYGDRPNQRLTQTYSSGELREQYEQLKHTHHQNVQSMSEMKKQLMTFEEGEEDKLHEFGEMLNKLKQFNAHLQAQAKIDDLLKQQEAIRKGMKDISSKLPEVLRKK